MACTHGLAAGCCVVGCASSELGQVSEHTHPFCLRVEELTETRQSSMNRVKIADKQVAATGGPAALQQAYIAKKAESAAAVDTQLQLFQRQGQVRVCCGCWMMCTVCSHLDQATQPWVAKGSSRDGQKDVESGMIADRLLVFWPYYHNREHTYLNAVNSTRLLCASAANSGEDRGECGGDSATPQPREREGGHAHRGPQGAAQDVCSLICRLVPQLCCRPCQNAAGPPHFGVLLHTTRSCHSWTWRCS